MDLYVTCGVSDLEHGRIDDSKHPDVNLKQSVSTEGDDSIADLEDALDRTLHIQDVNESLPGQLESLNRNETCHAGAKVCSEWIIEWAESATSSTQKGLTKSATFPCSKKDGSNGQSSSDRGPGCIRSISLPTPAKLVSAMKGSREKRGVRPEKLTVSWAPDVYDPPTTILSHTVKSYNQQRSRSNKKSSKHKQRGKSSRGGTSDKKQYRRAVSNSDLRTRSMASSNRLLFGGFDESTVELVDFVPGQDSNCGRSFLRTSLTEVHLSVAEAT